LRTACAILLGLLLLPGSFGDDRSSRRKLQELARKLERRTARSAAAEVNRFLHEQSAALIERAKEAQGSRYRFDRLSRAADDLLEASQRVFDSRERDKDDDEDQRDAARRLERTYFRVQQADYFARLSGHKDGAAFITHARALYQQARSAYDQRDYPKAHKLADAAGKIVGALERLAQAEVRVPDPPRLK
jgi:hypothetical protein